MSTVLGTVVLTAYNNNTYKVDDVLWDKDPTKTFECKGKQVTFVEYYQQKYQIRIRDLKQPLLVSRAKARDIKAGKEETILLIPELCRSTGKI